MPGKRNILVAALAVAALALAGAAVTTGATPLARSDQKIEARADYTIDARYEPKGHRIHGRQRLLWRNPAAEPVGELHFHLYLNAFRDRTSTFHRESAGRVRGARIDPKSDPGWIEVRSLRVLGSELAPLAYFAHPDTPDPGDRTVLVVPLPQAVPAGGVIAVDIEFEAKLPRAVARTGYEGDFVVAGQWFPKLGVYEPAGMRGRATGGWNCHQFHARSEFYADFGTYDVTIDVPAELILGATGRRMSHEVRGERARHRYRAENVHDFAWSTSPHFVEKRYRFDPARDVPAAWRREAARLLDRPESALALKPIEVRLLMQPEHEVQWTSYRDAANAAFAYYGLRYGPYPYGVFTIVDPPNDADAAAGMEYPTLVTGQTRRGMERWPMSQVRLIEVVTVHEVGHQWWQGMVASNEFEEPWLDEGINSYSEARVMDAAYGAVLDLPRTLRLTSDAGFRGAHIAGPLVDPIERRSWDYASGRSSTLSTYSRTAVALAQLESQIGAPAMARGMRSYFEQWSFRHPSADDFFAALARASGRDLTTLRHTMFTRPAHFDLAVVAADSRSEPAPERGEKEPEKAGSGDERWRTVVLVARQGDVPAATEVEFRWDDGRRERHPFPANATWVRYTTVRPVKLAAVAVDPDLRLLLDRNLGNNSRLLERDVDGFARAASRTQYLTAILLQWLWSLA